MAIHLGRSSPNASRDRPERRRGRPARRRPTVTGAACRSYLVLLPVGFALPPPLPAARCALTAPFHPCRPCRPVRRRRRAWRCVSVALSLGSPPPGVTRHRASVEPGLSSLPPTQGRKESGHPTVWHGTMWDGSPEAANRGRIAIPICRLVHRKPEPPTTFAQFVTRFAWLAPDPCGDSARRTGPSMLHWAALPGWPGPRRKADGV